MMSLCSAFQGILGDFLLVFTHFLLKCQNDTLRDCFSRVCHDLETFTWLICLHKGTLLRAVPCVDRPLCECALSVMTRRRSGSGEPSSLTGPAPNRRVLGVLPGSRVGSAGRRAAQEQRVAPVTSPCKESRPRLQQADPGVAVRVQLGARPPPEPRHSCAPCPS